MDSDEKSLLDAARECDDCVPWLKHCQAECCRGFRFRVDPLSEVERGDDEVRIRVRMTADLRRYFELHGASVQADAVVVPASYCTFTHDRLHVAMPCTALRPDSLCSLHPDGKPEGCSSLTFETARDRAYYITPHCLFAYKLRLLADEGDV